MLTSWRCCFFKKRFFSFSVFIYSLSMHYWVDMKGKMIQCFSPQLLLSWAAICIRSKRLRCFPCLPLIHHSVEVWGLAEMPTWNGKPMPTPFFCCLQELTWKARISILAGVSLTETSLLCWHQGGWQVLTGGICNKTGGNPARRLTSLKCGYCPWRGQKNVMLRQTNLNELK